MLDIQLEAAAGGRFEGLLGVVAKAVAPQPAPGRCKREGAHAHATHTVGKGGRGRGPRGVAQAWVAAARVLARRQASNVLCVCAGCVWAVRVRDSSRTRAENGWWHLRRRRGGC